MGFRKEPTHYRLTFENPDLRGLEVMAKSLPLRDFLAINRASVTAVDDSVKQLEQNEMLLKKFAEALLSWNLEDEKGKKIPSTFEGLCSQEFPFVMEIIQAWMEAIANIPKLQQSGSNGSGTYPEQSIPMEVS